jgi:chemotaxis protein CheC
LGAKRISHMLNNRQLEAFGRSLHESADDTSHALSRWLGRPSNVHFDSVEQLPLHEATRVLGPGEEQICFCVADMRGRLTGHVILAFSDAGGFALADLLLDQPPGTAFEWGEFETSAALETANILSCAYLNTLLRELPVAEGSPDELLPTPPRFGRDFAGSLIQFALMDQVGSDTTVVLAHVKFEIDGEPVDWTLLIVPDAASMAALSGSLK